MADNKALRRLPLRQLLASSDRTARETADLVQTHLLPRLSDFRDLTRPVRRKSHYPAMTALQNGLRRMLEAHVKLQSAIDILHDHLDAIRDHAQREKLNRRL